MSRLFDSRVGLPLAAMVPIGLLGCEADRHYPPYEVKHPPPCYSSPYTAFESATRHDGWGADIWADYDPKPDLDYRSRARIRHR